MTSRSLWIAWLWITIIGSRPVSLWLGVGVKFETPEQYLDGSPLDRNIFTLLILAGLGVLSRRKIEWNRLLISNRWLFIFFLYCGISVIWSDFPFVSLKRFVKDLGQLVMILIIVTEEKPIQAIKAVFARYTYFVMPLSILFIKYFPGFGRYYNRWTWESAFCGVTTNKNELGSIACFCGLFLIWELIEMRNANNSQTVNMDLLSRIILLLIIIWVIFQAGSATSLTCLTLGTVILLYMQTSLAKKQLRYLGTYTLVVSCLIIVLYTFPGFFEFFVGLTGRDVTLTGRTDVWSDLLNMPINSILGEGYQSFWLGPYAVQMWEKYSFHPTQAHNGYLETYLHGGMVGLCLLLVMIGSTGSRLKKELVHGDRYGAFFFTLLVVIMIYNWTEAFFNKLSPLWFILLLAVFSYRHQEKSVSQSIRNLIFLVYAASKDSDLARGRYLHSYDQEAADV